VETESSPTTDANPEPQTVYDLVGREFFDGLVDRFYAGVATDEILRPMYPRDLTNAKRHLADFLVQYWGGPDDYSRERGHPRLRMRHVGFPIDTAARDAWLHHMLAALDSSADLHPIIAEAMQEYFVMAAAHLINRQDPEAESPAGATGG
jgi:hemoglobin